MGWLFAIVAPALLAAAPAGDRPQLLIQELTSGAGVEPSIAPGLSEAIGAEIERRGYFKALTSKDVQTLLGVERQKQLVGCSDKGTSCLAELAGALGAPFVMSGAVSKVGNTLQLTLQTLDTARAQPIGRAVRIAHDAQTLRALLPWAIADATGTPPPPSPSRLPAIALISAGGVAVVAGGLFGLQAISQEQQYQRELGLGATRPGVLDSSEFYEQRGGELARQRSFALGGMVVGAALVGLGVWLLPSASGSAGVEGVALVPSASGVSLVGVLR